MARIVAAALDAGWDLAVASTSSEASVRAVLEHVVGAEHAARFALVLAGDVVARKKPAPDIYELAVERLGRGPGRGARDRGLPQRTPRGRRRRLTCVVTVSSYTEHEDFSEAVLVVSSLGEPDGERTKVLANRGGIPEPEGYVALGDLQACLGGREHVRRMSDRGGVDGGLEL